MTRLTDKQLNDCEDTAQHAANNHSMTTSICASNLAIVELLHRLLEKVD